MTFPDNSTLSGLRIITGAPGDRSNFYQIRPDYIGTGGQFEEVAFVGEIDRRPVLGVEDSEILVRRAEWDRNIACDCQYPRDRFTFVLRVWQHRGIVGGTLKTVGGFDVAGQSHDPVLGTMVSDRFAPDVLDDGGIAARILDREVNSCPSAWNYLENCLKQARAESVVFLSA